MPTERIREVWRWVDQNTGWVSTWKGTEKPKPTMQQAKIAEGVIVEEAHVVLGPLPKKMRAKIEKLLAGGCRGCP